MAASRSHARARKLGAIRNRTLELRTVRAGDLMAHPRNWRRHPEEQRRVLRGVLRDVGFVGAVVARKRKDGSLELVDGHLRADLDPEAQIPVLVTDLSEQEALAVLATHDPITGMAETDRETLRALLDEVSFASDSVEDWLDEMAASLGDSEETGDAAESSGESVAWEGRYEVVVEVDSEQEQEELFTRLTEEGLRCRVLSM